jgi:hypothetical protein
MPDIARLEVDFNDFDDDGRLGALVTSAEDPSALAVGALVLLWDEDGNTAQGRVVELAERGRVWLDVLRPTWHSGRDGTAEQVVAAALANVAPPVGLFQAVRPTACLVTPFGTDATPGFQFGQFFLFMGYPRLQAHATHSSAWPDHLDFAESYKLRSIAGVAPVTAELGP